MATKNPSENKDARSPLPDLSLLAPQLRLVSAAMWKVMKKRDVMHYGSLEEFVTSTCAAVPGLLTSRHQARLALGLRGRLILELCRGRGPLEPEAILPQLDRMRVPGPSSSSATRKRDRKVETAVANFRDLVHTLLRDPVEREHFNQELHVDYGPQFDQELEKLLWEFLIRLDSLLPAPDLAQTVSWLIAAPAVQEECARAPSHPQLLRTLFQHHNCLGHIGSAASLSPCVGDSIFDSLSLPLSGRVAETAPGHAQRPPSPESGPRPPKTARGCPTSPSPLVEPAIGRKTNGDGTIVASAGGGTGSGPGVSIVIEDEEEEEAACGSKYTGVKQRSNVRTRRIATKRRRGDAGAGSREDAAAAGGGRRRRSLRGGASRGESPGGRGGGAKGGAGPRARPEEEAELVARCLLRRPRVLLHRLSLDAAARSQGDGEQAGKSAWLQDRSPEGAANGPVVHDGKFDLAGKEKCDGDAPSVPSIQRGSPAPSRPAPVDVIPVIQSEDAEASGHFEGRLCVQRCRRKPEPPSRPEGIPEAQNTPIGPVVSRQYEWIADDSPSCHWEFKYDHS